MNHCFLLDGKTILPIKHTNQIYTPLKTLNKTQKKSRSHSFNHHCQYYSSNEKLNATNNNKHDLLNDEHFCSYSLQSTEKMSEKKYRNYSNEQRNICKFHHVDQQKSNDETYLIQTLVPSINFTIESSQTKNNQANKTPSAITIIIKPFESSENSCQNNRSFDKKRKKSLSSSCSLKTSAKRLSTSVSHQRVNKHRLSTFKDITRVNRRNSSSSSNINEKNRFSNIFQSKTLLDIYRNKKTQYI